MYGTFLLHTPCLDVCPLTIEYSIQAESITVLSNLAL